MSGDKKKAVRHVERKEMLKLHDGRSIEVSFISTEVVARECQTCKHYSLLGSEPPCCTCDRGHDATYRHWEWNGD